MRCVYCQNWQISQDQNYFTSTETDFEQAAWNIVYLQNTQGVHNINFVSPSHFVPQMVRIIYEAIPMGLNIPIVYNTNAYDSSSTLKLLDGIVDIYLPDFKYFKEQNGVRFSRTQAYSTFAKQAIKEMQRQVGSLQLDKRGIAHRGLLIRHLVLPNGIADSKQVFELIVSNLGKDTMVSLLAQYYPTHKAPQTPLLARRITETEYNATVTALRECGLSTRYAQ